MTAAAEYFEKGPVITPLQFKGWDDYCAAMEIYLTSNSKKRGFHSFDQQLEWNRPFHLSAIPGSNYQGRFLLIHGLNDGPFSWFDIAQDLAGMGFDVRVVLLPGHGTKPGDSFQANHKVWLDLLRSLIREWSENGDYPIHLGGFSTGGVLSTIMLQEGLPIAGLLHFASAYRCYQHTALPLTNWLKRVKNWLNQEDEANPVRYESFSCHASGQYYYTTEKARKNWTKQTFDIPVLSILSTDDSVADFKEARRIFHTYFSNPQNRLVIYQGRYGKDLRIDPVQGNEVLRDSYSPEDRILNQSHLSMMFAPENPLYGRGKNFIMCNGYSSQGTAEGAPKHWFGAWGSKSPDDQSVARTTYNPDYAYMMEQVRQVFVK